MSATGKPPTSPGELADELHAFGNAVMFFTRIPVPKRLRWSDALMQKAAAWYPAVGWIVGGVGASVTWLGFQVFATPLVPVLLGMIATLLLTGAFHEDGLADTCDAFFGGYTRDRVLEIMKDSRVGSFGAAGLIMVLLTKAALLTACIASTEWVRVGSPVLCLIMCHSISRAASATLLRLLTYVRANDLVGAKSKPMATRISSARLLFALLVGFAPAAFFVAPRRLPMLIALVAVTTVGMAVWFRKRIGGYTGDCLGATQQIVELVVLAVLAAQVSLWK
jgi:adenosylcobinamide-GDP ribazoletransferase